MGDFICSASRPVSLVARRQKQASCGNLGTLESKPPRFVAREGRSGIGASRPVRRLAAKVALRSDSCRSTNTDLTALRAPVTERARRLLLKPRRPLFLELRRAPAHCGRHALGSCDLAKTRAELGGGRVKRADHVEPGIERGAEPGGVCDAVNRTLGRVVAAERTDASMLPIEGPSAWVGADMRGREAEWS